MSGLRCFIIFKDVAGLITTSLGNDIRPNIAKPRTIFEIIAGHRELCKSRSANVMGCSWLMYSDKKKRIFPDVDP